ncbi:hypothetical protein [Pleurocapsa sp. PCC 7319]|uniref:hypothetical protein n=1 Tax=Pleurocapsa sp. PCC 7319 TaxID=118161 RepID=UPI00037CDF35|nr:hypothetical protein [Pleurocapsa sp. PCC 7319]
MKHLNIFSSFLLLLALTACSEGGQVSVDADRQSSSSSQSESTTEPTVIDLTQVGCQFLEVESKNYQYQPTSAEDCKKINSETLAARESEFKSLDLKPGKYIFRVTNSNVPYQLGFYLRGEGLKKVSLPKVSGGGLTQGTTKDYEITLAPGKYVFSCPLNPTPDYPIVVN